MERRLAAIVSADVAGYSRLMEQDEEATVRTLAAYREEVDLLVRQHGGRVVDFTGDNFLAEFASSVNAVQSAQQMQSVLRARNAHLAQDRRMEFRFGVHVGDVRVEGERIYGHGVNVAARLQSLAEPGGICVSDAVREQIGRALGLSYRDLGPQSLKNIPEPVRAYQLRSDAETVGSPRPRRVSARAGAALAAAALVAVAVAAFLTFGGGPPKESGPPLTSIAVLPFDDMSPGGDQKWLADGMAEELIETLSRIEALRVLARTSAFAMKGKDIAAVGAELRVGSVIEGSVRRSDDQLRVTAQLIRVSDGSHLWSARYDRKLSDVFAIQTEIARAIAEAIRGELGIEYEDSWLSSHEPSDVRAYELVKKGLDTMFPLLTEEGIRKSMGYYEQALAIDPDYAQAHAELGFAHYWLWFVHGRAEANLAMARTLSERALVIDATNGSGHNLLATVLLRQHQWEEARRVLDRGLAHNPGHGPLRQNSAVLFGMIGRKSEALVEARRAADLDPRALTSRWVLGFISLLTGDYDAAIEDLRHAWTLPPEFATRELLSYAYHRRGNDQEALEALVRDLPAELSALESAVRQGSARAGYAGAVRTFLDGRIANSGRPCTNEVNLGALDFAILGEADAMFDCLSQAVDRRDLLFLQADPVYDPYRSDPRFTALLRRMNLAE